MIKTVIGDGEGSGRGAKVLPDGEILVAQSSTPPLISQKTKVIHRYLTDDGTKTGSGDMGIDGSATAVNFFLEADDKNDTYITQLSMIVGYGASAPLFNWVDSGGVLTNGARLTYVDTQGDVIEIFNATRNSDFLRAALADGITPADWELRHLGALNDYGFMFVKSNGLTLVSQYSTNP